MFDLSQIRTNIFSSRSAPFYFIIFTLMLIGIVPTNAQQSSSPSKMIVYGIFNYLTYPPNLSIGYVDLERKVSGILVPQIGLLSYKPSSSKHYLAYSHLFVGRLARCEVRDLEQNANVIYVGSIAKQCMPLWTGNSRRVILANESLTNTWTVQIFDTQTGLVQKTDLSFSAKDSGTWEASTAPNDESVIFKIIRPDGDYGLTVLDLKTGKSTIIPVAPAYDWEFVWSPLGDKALLVSRPIPDVKIYLYTIASNTIYLRDYGSTISWSPDDKNVSYLINHLQLNFFDTDSKQIKVTTSPNNGLLLDVTWIDKQFVLVSTVFSRQYDDREFKLWKVDTQTLEWLPLSETHEKLSWDISPDNKFVRLIFLDNGVWTVEALDLSTKKTKIITTSRKITDYIGCQSNGYTNIWINTDNLLSPTLFLDNAKTGETISQSLPGWQNFSASCYLVDDDNFVLIQSNNGAWAFDIRKRTPAKFLDFPIMDYEEARINDGDQFYFIGLGISDDREIYEADLETAQVENLTQTTSLYEFAPLLVNN